MNDLSFTFDEKLTWTREVNLSFKVYGKLEKRVTVQKPLKSSKKTKLKYVFPLQLTAVILYNSKMIFNIVQQQNDI